MFNLNLQWMKKDQLISLIVVTLKINIFCRIKTLCLYFIDFLFVISLANCLWDGFLRDNWGLFEANIVVEWTQVL